MRTSTGTIATACALSAALLVAGCGGDGAHGMKPSGRATKSNGEVFLQPVAARGPDPFTDSTATAPSAPPRVTRTPQSTPTGPAPALPTPTRTFSGATPGLYGGTARSGSCDVERQIAYLTRDQTKAGAFAQAEGISRSAIPGYLRGLTSVVLRADTQVTNHGFRDARVTGFQSVLEAGTAVLVDNRGVPRVRCACGNPLKAGVAGGTSGSSGRGWTGYRPAEVVVVTPAPQVITNITIVNVIDNTWIERPLGHRGPHHDHVVRPPVHVLPTRPGTTPTPHGSTSPRPHDSHSSAPTGGTGTPSSGTSPSSSASPDPLLSVSPSSSPSTSPSDESASPGDGRSTAPDKSTTPCTTPTVTVTPGAAGAAAARIPAPGATGCPTATVTATPRTVAPQSSQVPGSPDEIGPPTVPETPDQPDGGGLIPGDATSSIFDSPTGVFGG
ncbi:hypothetical protein SAMN05216489_01434 [Streptomyces sp. 3213]|uniref:DUF6777 domain-containing protein n=1 Tax=Streptomyces sp. 3213.3 TaxID=1855348 RepID=UPI000899B048|nr:DUF6777 domain-containing protein [Streptomyces sp. 3213.3]SEC71347.1 hypothetical protein SAMN05216489_01434 [Streptomyces sp. 3213] [Streptomyces sp. 3213.3]